MKKLLSMTLLAVALMAFGHSAQAQEDLYLCAYFTPYHLDTPGTASLSKYRIFLTENNGKSFSEIQAELLADTTLLRQCTYICHPIYYNSDFNQYATADYSVDQPDPSTHLTGVYEPTNNTVMVVVYSDANHFGLNVIPRGDYPEYYDDQDDEGGIAGSGWNSNGPVAVDRIDNADFNAYVNGKNIVVKGAEGNLVEVFATDGRLISASMATAEAHVAVPAAGLYIVRVKDSSVKVLAR